MGLALDDFQRAEERGDMQGGRRLAGAAAVAELHSSPGSLGASANRGSRVRGPTSSLTTPRPPAAITLPSSAPRRS